MRIAVCEDAPREAAHVAELLGRYRETHPQLQVEVRLFPGGGALVEAVEGGEAFDLFLLDVIMPGMDGIALAKALRALGSRSPVIYLTSSADYAVAAYGVRAIHYLVKPVEARDLFPALDEAAALLGSRLETYTQLSTAGGPQWVALGEIAHVEGTGHVLHYHLAGGGVLTTKVLRVCFEQAAADLIADRRFLRPHQSFLVNAGHVARFSARELALDTGASIPVSRLRAPAVKAEYMSYLARRGRAAGGVDYGCR